MGKIAQRIFHIAEGAEHGGAIGRQQFFLMRARFVGDRRRSCRRRKWSAPARRPIAAPKPRPGQGVDGGGQRRILQPGRRVQRDGGQEGGARRFQIGMRGNADWLRPWRCRAGGAEAPTAGPAPPAARSDGPSSLPVTAKPSGGRPSRMASASRVSSSCCCSAGKRGLLGRHVGAFLDQVGRRGIAGSHPPLHHIEDGLRGCGYWPAATAMRSRSDRSWK